MMFWRTENKIEPKKNFHLEIEEYYNKVSNNEIPKELLAEIIEKVTDKIYDDYKRFWEQYPKSRKRYSKLKLEDLKHSFVYYLITDLLRKKKLVEYRHFSKILFGKNDAELDDYEKGKFDYETK
ncbi:hypothetical protein [Flavobacterium sp. SM2513]|uniref:hypothetical protein n=1 Tax=Flavobacterium sp. SM2513 TaxID=3424766 RepID=UPI003D7FEA31